MALDEAGIHVLSILSDKLDCSRAGDGRGDEGDP